ncbi:hypothetical protein DFH06DRAFT_1123776 [Mycena polygramma]|nr:hypothetical protein DFH06DRAFT_1123776 [Mycena polygramma]
MCAELYDLNSPDQLFILSKQFGSTIPGKHLGPTVPAAQFRPTVVIIHPPREWLGDTGAEWLVRPVHRRLRANIKLWQAFRSRSACPRTLKPKIHSRLPSLENKEANFEGKFGFRLCGPMVGGTAQRGIAIDCGDRYEAVEPLRSKIRPQPHSLENKEAFSVVDVTNDGCGFSFHRRLRANINLWQAFRSRSACPRTLKPKIHSRLPSLENKEADFERKFGFRFCGPTNKEADFEGKFGFRLCGPMVGGTAQRGIAIDCGDRFAAVEPLRSKIRPQPHSLENKEAFSGVDLTNDGCGFSFHRRLRANINLWQAFRSRSACPRTLKPKIHSRLPSLENKEADFEGQFGFRLCVPIHWRIKRRILKENSDFGSAAPRRLRANIKLWQAFRSRSACPRTLKPKIHSRLPSLENKEADFEGKFGFRLCGPMEGGTAQRRIAIECGDRYEAVEPLRFKIRPQPHSLENKEAFSGVDLTNDGCGFSVHRRLRANIKLWQAFRSRSACPRTLKPKIHPRLPSLENKEADSEGKFGFRLCGPMEGGTAQRRIAIECGLATALTGE